MTQPSLATPEQLQQALREQFAPWLRELDLRVEAAALGEVRLALPVTPPHVHAGGVLCGQTMMAAADTAMVPEVAWASPGAVNRSVKLPI